MGVQSGSTDNLRIVLAIGFDCNSLILSVKGESELFARRAQNAIVDDIVSARGL